MGWIETLVAVTFSASTILIGFLASLIMEGE